MKKILLSAVALVAAMSVNAQVFQMNAEAQGITSDLTNVDAGKVWADVDFATISNPFATQHKMVDCKNNDYVKVLIDGNEIVSAGGVQGNDNPKDADGGNPAQTLLPATSGAVIQINAKADGWMYIVGKLSSNKQYVAFEEGKAIGYKLAMEISDARFPDNKINLELKGEGEFNYIPEGRKIDWVVREVLGDAEAATAGNGLGVIYFPVFTGCKYYAHATGSKISWCGAYFSATEASSIKVAKEDGTEFELLGATGIENVKAAKTAAENVAYNLAGQKVGNDFKGLVIVNGQKMIRK